MRRTLAMLATVTLLVAACGGGSDDSESADDPSDDTPGDAAAPTQPATEAPTSGTAALPADLPAECTEAPFELTVDADAIAGLDGPFTVETAWAKPQPLVPNPNLGGEGGDDQSQEEFLEGVEESKRLAAETDLLLYTIWLADFAFEADEIGLFGGPDLDPGGTVLGLTVSPTSLDGLAAGETVAGTDAIGYETFTSLAPMLSYLLTDLATEAFLFYQGEPSGTVEILHLDESWICVRWSDVGSTSGPDGEIAISGVILAPLTEREELPLS